MNKVSVICWKIENYGLGIKKPDQLLITYLQDNSGHDLITCKTCG